MVTSPKGYLWFELAPLCSCEGFQLEALSWTGDMFRVKVVTHPMTAGGKLLYKTDG